jgi:hypothetical protein
VELTAARTEKEIETGLKGQDNSGTGYRYQLLLSDRGAMLEPIKNTVNTKNLRKVAQNEEIRKMGRAARRAATHAGREFVKAFTREYEQERKKR